MFLGKSIFHLLKIFLEVGAWPYRASWAHATDLEKSKLRLGLSFVLTWCRF